jgi:hypothetical protein
MRYTIARKTIPFPIRPASFAMKPALVGVLRLPAWTPTDGPADPSVGSQAGEGSENKAGMSFVCFRLKAVGVLPFPIRPGQPVRAAITGGKAGFEAGMYNKNKEVAHISARKTRRYPKIRRQAAG